MAARWLVALFLLALLAWKPGNAPAAYTPWLWLGMLCYAAVAVVGWAVLRHKKPDKFWRKPWLVLLASDVFVVCFLQEVLQGKMQLSLLLALPILTAAVLGTMRLALATTASITLILLGLDGWQLWTGRLAQGDELVQTAMLCAVFFGVAYLTHQLSQRLAQQELQALQHQQAARLQALVNQLTVEHLEEGVVVLDSHYRVHLANPAACALLGVPHAMGLHDLHHPAWQPLRDVVDDTYASRQSLSRQLQLPDLHHRSLGLQLRTRLASASGQWPQPRDASATEVHHDEHLCVMFLHDLRAEEARMRTEKMAAMGRMSAAVAHEIRNPLAAIVQANALLAEELQQPAQQRLSQMVEANARRLARIVEDVLNIARVQQQPLDASHHLALDAQLLHIWQEWQRQQGAHAPGRFHPGCAGAQIVFGSEQLQRLVVNLLDNAARHSSARDSDALQLLSGVDALQVWLQVWNAGPALEASVHRHLFEPFFSSQSRSTGLGLYICRELCQRYGASISYARIARRVSGRMQPGHAFTVHFAAVEQACALPSSSQL